MRNIKILCGLLIACVIIPVCAKNPIKQDKYGVYIAGVSASFTDSLIYFTDIQFVDSALINKSGLLDGRAQYSMQLKDYLEQKLNGKNRTCFVYYNTKKKKLQKEVSKLREKYKKGGSLVIQDITTPDFKFQKAEQY